MGDGMTNSKQGQTYNVIGKNIKKYRKLKGMTQRELAERLLLSESFIAKLESVTYQSISVDTLKQIADVLEVHIAFFVIEDLEEFIEKAKEMLDLQPTP